MSRRAANHSNHHRRSSRARTLSQALHSNAQGSLQPSCRCLQTQNRALLRIWMESGTGNHPVFCSSLRAAPNSKEKKEMTYIKPFITLFLGGARVSLKFNPLELNWILQCLCVRQEDGGERAGEARDMDKVETYTELRASFLIFRTLSLGQQNKATHWQLEGLAILMSKAFVSLFRIGSVGWVW